MDITADTSSLVALLDTHDLWHARAVALEAALRSAGYEAVYFDCVIAETVSVLTRRLREKKRVQEVDSLLDLLAPNLPPGSITWIGADVPAMQLDILALVRASQGALNFNDALIALASRDRDIGLVASFDRDFDEVPWLRRLAEPDEVI